MQDPHQLHIETQIIRRRTAAGPHREQVTPIYLASGFTFYGMQVLKPGFFLKKEREAGRLKPASTP